MHFIVILNLWSWKTYLVRMEIHDFNAIEVNWVFCNMDAAIGNCELCENAESDEISRTYGQQREYCCHLKTTVAILESKTPTRFERVVSLPISRQHTQCIVRCSCLQGLASWWNQDATLNLPSTVVAPRWGRWLGLQAPWCLGLVLALGCVRLHVCRMLVRGNILLLGLCEHSSSATSDLSGQPDLQVQTCEQITTMRAVAHTFLNCWWLCSSFWHEVSSGLPVRMVSRKIRHIANSKSTISNGEKVAQLHCLFLKYQTTK